MYLLSRIRKYITTEACIAIFKTMVLSVIEYGYIIYSGTSTGNFNKIIKFLFKHTVVVNGN